MLTLKHILGRCALSLVLAASACTQAAAPTATPAAPADPRTALVGELAGTVNGRPAPAEPLAPVTVGFRLQSGGEVQTGEASKARLDFNDGTILRLAANSAFTLRSVAPAADGSLTGRVTLAFGRLWVTLFGGELQVETPVGVASVRGSYAVFWYQPGDPDNPDDDLLVVDCLEGSCGAQNDVVDERLGNLERVVLSRQASLRQALTGLDVQAFLRENPEAQALVATLTAAPPATATPLPTATRTLPPSAASATPAASAVPPEATSAPATTAGPAAPPAPTETLVPVTLTPGFTRMGVHTVRAGETLFCLGRGYGVLPGAIAAANALDPAVPLSIGQRLDIPAAPWTPISAGPVCGPQFQSLFPGLPTATVTPTPTFTASAVICPAGQFFDPGLGQCQPLPPTATATVTPAPTATPFLLSTATFVPLVTPTFTAPPTATFTPPPTATATPTPTPTVDAAPPVISNLIPNPTTLNYPCSVTFSANLSDPAGVDATTVQANYATNYFGTPLPGNSTALTLASGSVFAGTWTSAVSITNSPGGYLNWSVQAADAWGNSGSTTSPITVTLSYCP